MIGANIGQRHLSLEGAYNVRDVGGYKTRDGYTTRWHTLLRADSLHKLTTVSQQYLIEYGLSTVIDLRSKSEVATEPNIFTNSREVKYLNISLAEAAPDSEPGNLPDLESLYKYVLDERQGWVKAVFDVMTQEAFPILIHCTGGKDRTGIITALVLGLANVDYPTIAEDYALTGYYNDQLNREFRARADAKGREAMYLGCNPETMLDMLAHLETKYQSVMGYLLQIGLTTTQLDRLYQTIVTQCNNWCDTC